MPEPPIPGGLSPLTLARPENGNGGAYPPVETGGIPFDYMTRRLGKRRTSLILLAAILVGLGVVYLNRHEILILLDSLSDLTRNHEVLGYAIVMSLIFIASFPPVVGYGVSLHVAGFICGFPGGFIPGASASLAGAVACFLLCRKYFQKSARGYVARHPKLQALTVVIERKGFKLLLLTRIAPFPFNIVNALLSTTNVSTATFSLATALSLVKTLSHIWIGSSLKSLTEIGRGAKTHDNGVLLPALCIGISLALGTAVYSMRAVNEVLRESESVSHNAPTSSASYHRVVEGRPPV